MEIRNYEMSASILIPEYITSRGYFVFMYNSGGVIGIKKDEAGRWNIVRGSVSELSLFTSRDWFGLARTTEQSFYNVEYCRCIRGRVEGITKDGEIKMKTENPFFRFGLSFLYSSTKNITRDDKNC